MKAFILATTLTVILLLVALDAATDRWPWLLACVRVVLALEVAGLIALAFAVSLAWYGVEAEVPEPRAEKRS